MRIIVFLLLLLVAPGWGEELYVKGRVFPGPLTGQGTAIMVGLESLAKTLGLEMQQLGGGYYLGRKGAAGADKVETGTVSVEGTVVESQQESVVMVNLAQAVQALGLDLKVSEDRLEVNVPTGWISSAGRKAGPANPALTLPPGPAKVKALVFHDPAGYDYRDYLVRGRVNIFLYYNLGEREAGFNKLPFQLDQLAASSGDVYVIKVEVGKQETTAFAKRIGRVPQMRIFSPSGAYRITYPGHSILEEMPRLLGDPNYFNKYK